ncbi:putative Zinc finger, FYVE/PHD-type, Zinc finger, RING/FYVE/PHD-type [Septoria linicola]|nr:putative Zinc finger, FYVE/PHD-type, Zinc finger, RING/FYVE/PHD-type [Septoria linicola]
MSHKPPIRIKEEPQEDDDLFVGDADVLGNIWTDTIDSQNSRRAKASDGKPFNSQCFESPYLARPQFHRLRCGHDVATLTVQTCGSNCHPPTRFTGSDLKPNDTSFECPHPDCARLVAVTPRINPKTRRRIYGRSCQLAHVRGRHAQADLDWDVEKIHLTKLRGRTQRLNPKDKELVRKTSRSPTAPKSSMPPPLPRPRRQSTRLTAEQVARDMDEATRKLFVAQKGKRTRALRGDRPETWEDIELDTAERDLTTLGIDAKSRSATKRTRLSKSAPVMPFTESIGGRHDHCGHCDLPLTGEFFVCEDCMDDDQDYTLCGECNTNAYSLHLRANPSHRLVLRQSSPCAPDVGTGIDEQSTQQHCVCKSRDIRFMIACQDCSRSFHPGCVGKGLQDKVHYEIPNREKFFEADFEHTRKHGIDPFLCHPCEALNKFNAGISALRRGARKRGDLLLEFKPKLMAQKQIAMERAKTLEQEVVVEKHFAVIEAQMDATENFELWHWRSLLAQALKVPLPQVRAPKRNVEAVANTSDEVETSSTPPDESPVTQDHAKRAKKNTNEIAVPSQEYRYGGQMTLAMGSGKQGR